MEAKIMQAPKRIFPEEVAISNLIATLILIAIAVVGGGFAYTAFRNQAQSATTSADLQVQSLDAITSDGTVYLSATVKNVGSQRLTNVHVYVDPGGQNVDLDVGNLDPGQTGSADATSTNLSAGTTYAVKITADTPDGGSLAKTTTVRVQS